MWLTVLVCFATALPPPEAAATALPEGLISIREEAFFGDAGLRNLTLPEGVEEIGARAFAYTQLRTVTLPESLHSIAEDAFLGVSTAVLIETEPGSVAARYALFHELDFRAGTVCRALLIGQSEYPGKMALEGPKKDMGTMQSLLEGDYEVHVAENLSPEEMLSAISETFADAREADLSLLYYSGHGLSSSEPGKNGAFVGIDYESYLTPGELRQALDYIPGRKIVLVDACYSGALIDSLEEDTVSASAASEEAGGDGILAEAADTIAAAEAAVMAFVSAFSDVYASALSGGSAPRSYFVLASSRADEKSWESDWGGLFTQALAASSTSADMNGDEVVSLQECYKYTMNAVSDTVTEKGLKQSVQVSPENCTWFGMFR